jgi:putative effector of murein hydrolase LrgA (UPF0299 family)
MGESSSQDTGLSVSELLVGGLILLAVPATVTVVLYLSDIKSWFAWTLGVLLLWWFIVGPILVHKYGWQ